MRKSSAGSIGASPAGTAARSLRGAAGRPLPAGETKQNETKRNETKENEKQRKKTPLIAVSRSPPSPALPRSRAAHPARPGPPRLGLAAAGCGARSGGGGGAPFPRCEREPQRLPRAGPACEPATRGGVCGGTGGGTGGAGRCGVARLRVWLRSVRDGGAAVGSGRAAGWRRRTSRPLRVLGRGRHLRGRAGGAGRPGRRSRTCRPVPGPDRAVCGQGPAGRARAGVPTYLHVLSTGRRGGGCRGSLPGPRPRRTVPAPAGRVPGRRGALRGSSLPEYSLNTLLFLAGRPEPGRGPALPPPLSNGEAAPGPSLP